ncbi:MAG: family 20 glycosylhydrolase, partial [Planctomycetota bacterium]
MTVQRKHISRIFPAPQKLELGPPGDEINLTKGWGLVCESPAAKTLLDEYSKLLQVPVKGNGKPIRLIAGDLPDQGYAIDVSQTEGQIAATSESGFRYALETLRQIVSAGRVPPVSIEDAPQLDIRGFHFYLHRQFEADEVTRFIDAAARSKLNTIIPEYFGRFPYSKHRRIRQPSAFSKSEVRKLTAHAAAQGVQIIPLQQSLGHLNYLLRHDAYAGIREESEVMDQMCPLNPKSFETFTELAEDILSLHPDAKFLHVGGDETWHLGVCPKCSDAAERIGKGGLYGTYMKKVLEWVVERGLRPIIWNDIICRYPETLDFIPPQTVIMVWEYWTVSDPTPVIEARYGRDGALEFIHDKRWGGEWPLDELTDLQRIEMLNASKPADIEAELNEQFMEEFGKYLGSRVPKFFRAYPYIEYFQDKGFDVIAAPTAMGGTEELFGAPNFERFFHNLHTAATRCKQNARTLGLINTSWWN